MLLALVLLWAAPAFAAEGVAVSQQVLTRLVSTYGGDALGRLLAWSSLLEELPRLPERQKLERVNRFFNTLAFVPDDEHWQQEDYWATPVEFIASDGGDCEDFAIAKFFTLKAVGVPSEAMRLAYVKALTLDQAHMVLVYYPPAPSEGESTQSAEPLVLDNLVDEILPASSRKDLLPVYSFNGEGLWQARSQGQDVRLGRGEDVLMWKTLIERIKLQEK